MNFPTINLNLLISQICQKSGPYSIHLSLNQPVAELHASTFTFLRTASQKVVYRATLNIYFYQSLY